jgi:hypothetical protein
MDGQEAVDRGADARLVSLGAAYLGLSAWMFSQEAEMRRGGGPGIVGLELAGSTGRVEKILAAWGQDGRAAARRPLSLAIGSLSPTTFGGPDRSSRTFRATPEEGLSSQAIPSWSASSPAGSAWGWCFRNQCCAACWVAKSEQSFGSLWAAAGAATTTTSVRAATIDTMIFFK